MNFNFEEQVKQKTDKELNELFINAKDYNNTFNLLVEQELQKRNINLDKSKQIRYGITETDMLQLEKGKPGSPLYIFICFVLAILGGLIAIYAGYIYSQSKTLGYDGKGYYVYDEQTRKLGNIMMWVGIGSAVLCFVFRPFK